MSELRWILLLVGVLFLIALTAWESRRARLARAAARERARAMSDTFPFDSIGAAASAAPADVPAEPLDAADSPELSIRADRHINIDSRELPSVRLEGPEAAPAEGAGGDGGQGAVSDIDVPTLAAAAGMHAAAAATTPAAPRPQADVEEPSAGATTGVTVEWPPEEQRSIVSVRIVSTSEQRLSGRATRQALAACGFVHGRYRIFHQPDAQGHALLSCASLNKPGVFDPSSMDYQRYSGLSLFTVLPGPLSPPEAVDRLLHTALDLSERLHARLQDEEGQTLDQARIAALLTRYRGLDAMAGPPA